jgi:hypothetical protein
MGLVPKVDVPFASAMQCNVIGTPWTLGPGRKSKLTSEAKRPTWRIKTEFAQGHTLLIK